MNKTKRTSRISTLWVLIMVGLIYHTVLHFAPVFYGVDIVKPNATGEMPLTMILTFGLAYLIPVASILLLNFVGDVVCWAINFVFSLFALLINTAHISELFVTKQIDPTQLFVLIPEFLLAVLLVADSWKLKKDR